MEQQQHFFFGGDVTGAIHELGWVPKEIPIKSVSFSTTPDDFPTLSVDLAISDKMLAELTAKVAPNRVTTISSEAI